MGTRNAVERRKVAGKHRKESFSVKREVAARYEPQANKKFFGAAVFQKCCRGVGEQPTFAKQTIFQQVLPAAIAFFETVQFKQSETM